VHALARSSAIFLLSVLSATLLGTLMQTQLNLAALGQLGAEFSISTRWAATLADLRGFAPLYLLVVFTSLVLAFPVAAALSRWWRPEARKALFILAGFIGLATGYLALDAMTPPPTLIAATRGFFGLFLMCLGGALAGWLYASLAPLSTPPRMQAEA
jgi:hypothetical protein